MSFSLRLRQAAINSAHCFTAGDLKPLSEGCYRRHCTMPYVMLLAFKSEQKIFNNNTGS